MIHQFQQVWCFQITEISGLFDRKMSETECLSENGELSPKRKSFTGAVFRTRKMGPGYFSIGENSLSSLDYQDSSTYHRICSSRCPRTISLDDRDYSLSGLFFLGRGLHSSAPG